MNFIFRRIYPRDSLRSFLGLLRLFGQVRRIAYHDRMVKLRDKNPANDSPKEERLAGLDAARGVFLFLLVARGLGVTNPAMLDQNRWGWLTSQWTHRAWQGCTIWDLLLPGMLLCAGMAMPYSYANRLANGQAWPRQFLHVLLRSGLLILLGVYLDSFDRARLSLEPRGDLQIIGIAYFFAFLIMRLGLAAQGVAAAFLLVGHTAIYVIHALAGGHELWAETSNFGAALDGWIRLSPHPDRLVAFNAVPAVAMMLLGMLVGGLMRSGLTSGMKVAILTGASFAGILLGWILGGGNGWIEFGWSPLVPLVRRLMTMSFVLLSVGWAALIFTYISLMTEALGLQVLAVPFTVLGRNPLVVYVVVRLCRTGMEKSVSLFVPTSPAAIAAIRPLLVELGVLFIVWAGCCWLYRRQIFVKA